jgi:hypothetical protein
MKKVIASFVVLVMILGVSILLTGIFKKLEKQKSNAEKIEKFPSFTFATLMNEAFNSSKIDKGPVLVVHFHPECEHCQYEISELLKSNIPVSGTTVILVSSALPDSIRKFLDQYDLYKYASVIPLIDAEQNFENIFGKGVVPSIYTYDINLNLVKVFRGEVKPETLIKSFETSE